MSSPSAAKLFSGSASQALEHAFNYIGVLVAILDEPHRNTKNRETPAWFPLFSFQPPTMAQPLIIVTAQLSEDFVGTTEPP